MTINNTDTTLKTDENLSITTGNKSVSASRVMVLEAIRKISTDCKNEPEARIEVLILFKAISKNVMKLQ